MIRFNSVAQMVASSQPAGVFIDTGGYYADGGSGAARYFVEAPGTTTPDEQGAAFTLANGNIAVLQLNGIAYVEQFGAIGDGTTDNSAAIQSALDWAAGSENEYGIQGGDVRLGRGIYIAEGLTIEDKTKISGLGQQNSILRLKAASTTWLLATEEYSKNTTFSDWGQTFKDFTLDGNKANAASGKECLIVKSFRSFIQTVRVIDSASHGILFTRYSDDGTGPSSGGGHTVDSRCVISDNDGAGIYIDGPESPSDSYITNNIIHNNGDGVVGTHNIECAADALAPGWRIEQNQMFKGWYGNIKWRQAVSGGINNNTLAHEPAVLDSNPTFAGELVNVDVEFGTSAGSFTVNNNAFPLNEGEVTPSYVHLRLDPLFAPTLPTGIIFGGNSFGSENSLTLTTVDTTATVTYPIIDSGNAYSGYAVEAVNAGIAKAT